jgi:hypothetical protein
MGCPCDVNNPATYLNCSGDVPRIIASRAIMMQYAALAGASSSNYTMCLTMTFLAARRMQYWKVVPGDCSSAGTQVVNTSGQVEVGVQRGLATGAAVDPEPISRGILAGVAAIFGGFTAAHAQAVASEQNTLCAVSQSFNYVATQLEEAVSAGQLDTANASSIMEQAIIKFNAQLNPIKSGQNAAWGYQIAMTALKNFEEEVVFPALQTLAQGQAPSAPATGTGLNIPTFAPSAPATYVPPTPPQIPALSQPISLLPNSAGNSYQGASGFVPTQMTGTNMGVGATTSILPASITPGTVVIIAGIAYVASRPGVVNIAA